MARIVTKKRRRIRGIEGVSVVLFSVALLMWLIASLVVNTVNTSLTISIQAMQEEVEILRTENQALKYDINTLGNKERIYALAQEANLFQNTNNIIALSGE